MHACGTFLRRQAALAKHEGTAGFGRPQLPWRLAAHRRLRRHGVHHPGVPHKGLCVVPWVLPCKPIESYQVQAYTLYASRAIQFYSALEPCLWLSWVSARASTVAWCCVNDAYSTRVSVDPQFVREFAKLGLTKSVGGVLGLALSRELTPVVTCIIIAGAPS